MGAPFSMVLPHIAAASALIQFKVSALANQVQARPAFLSPLYCER